MAASTAARGGRRGVALAIATAAVVLGAAAATWGAAPVQAGVPAAAAAAVPAAAAAEAAAILDSVAAVRAANAAHAGAVPAATEGLAPARAAAPWVARAAKKAAPKKWTKPAAKKTAKKAWTKPTAKKAAAKTWAKKPAAPSRRPPPPPTGGGGRPPPPGPSSGPACSPLRPYLVQHYTLAWRLAMLDTTAGRAFGIFATARAHAAAYVRAHPRTPTTVCGLRPVTAALTRRAVTIVAAHRDRRGPLPPGGRFRGMNKAERSAMARVLGVPLRKGVPKYMLPKRVPMMG